eukprot:SAG22_NODE_10678_length_521_cov_0.857820_2_plen_47_part_01
MSLAATFWEAPVIKQYPLSLIEGGHIGNPIFQMMGGSLHTLWDAFKT